MLPGVVVVGGCLEGWRGFPGVWALVVVACGLLGRYVPALQLGRRSSCVWPPRRLCCLGGFGSR